MVDFSIAVKSFIINDSGELLIIKRRDNDVHKPGVWEIPGGRLDPGEDPFEGLKRETKEETGLEIEVKNPLRIHHFTRDDGQIITMIVFVCRPLNDGIELSEEHTAYEWATLDGAYDKIVDSFKDEITEYKKLLNK